MIVLDTNVLSALMQLQPDAQVVAWLDGQPAESIWLSTVSMNRLRSSLPPAMSSMSSGATITAGNWPICAENFS